MSALFTQICYGEFMKKLLGIIVLGLLLSGNAYAEIKLFECIAVKDNSIYDKNVRLFDTKKGTYILIKKKVILK